MRVRRAAALDRHLLSISLYTSSLCDTFSHVFTIKPYFRSRVLEKNIIISHGPFLGEALTAEPPAKRFKKTHRG